MAISYSRWIDLSGETRVKIADALGIPKMRSTHVSDNKVVDDGYNLKDIENALSVPSLQTYLGSTETDVFKLFQMIVDKMEGRWKPAVEITKVDDKIVAVPVEEVKPKIQVKSHRGRPKKK